MKLEDIKIGMKVILLGKHGGGDNYSDIKYWYNDVKGFDDTVRIHDQGYGFVSDIRKNGEVCVKESMNSLGRWRFKPNDLESYEEKQKQYK